MKTTYNIDPAHSSAHFVARHMMITNVRGSFQSMKGTIVYDPDDPAASSIEASIDASSINTNEPQRDTHLKSPDFLDVAEFPTIDFKSTSVTNDGEGEYKVNGTLSIHGVTKPVTLKVEGPSPEGKDPWGNTRIGASASTKIKRSDFGLTWNAVLETGGFLVGDELKIELEVQAIKASS
ncbi:MAG: YceI family protein [Acidobacteriaceae bacterium]|nr:YceI family protein [Acidobacteriaceae bacterium]